MKYLIIWVLKELPKSNKWPSAWGYDLFKKHSIPLVKPVEYLVDLRQYPFHNQMTECMIGHKSLIGDIHNCLFMRNLFYCISDLADIIIYENHPTLGIVARSTLQATNGHTVTRCYWQPYKCRKRSLGTLFLRVVLVDDGISTTVLRWSSSHSSTHYKVVTMIVCIRLYVCIFW